MRSAGMTWRMFDGVGDAVEWKHEVVELGRGSCCYVLDEELSVLNREPVVDPPRLRGAPIMARYISWGKVSG